MLRSACAIAGLLLVGGGCSWAWPPLGPIVVGAALVAGAVWGYLREDVLADQSATEPLGFASPKKVNDGPAA